MVQLYCKIRKVFNMNQVIFRKLLGVKNKCFEFEYYKMVGCSLKRGKAYFVLENIRTYERNEVSELELKKYERI